MIVVAAALIRDARVLAARRSSPPELAGRWEFPGGKVEAGESEPAALVRECAEELGVAVDVGELLGRTAIRTGVGLHLYRATLRAGRPRPLADHDQLRWLAAGELAELDWLDPDRPLLVTVQGLLLS